MKAKWWIVRAGLVFWWRTGYPLAICFAVAASLLENNVDEGTGEIDMTPAEAVTEELTYWTD